MKKRKVLAFVLSLALIITLIPASAFAGTTNTVNRVVTVAADEDIPAVTLTLKAGNAFTSTSQAIKLTLTNATWSMDEDNIKANPDKIFVKGTGVVGSPTGPSIGLVGSGSTMAAIVTAKAISVDESSAEFQIQTTGFVAADNTITLTLALVADSDEGEVKVAIDALDSELSSGTYTVAIVGSDKTTATVVGSIGSTWRGAYTGNTIEIRENSVNSVPASASAQDLKLTLPSGMTWVGTVGGTWGGNLLTTVSAIGLGNDGRDLYVRVTTNGIDTLRQVLTFKPDIHVGKDAKLGDITVAIRNNTSGSTKTIANASGLVIGKYVEESVTVTTVKEADLPEIIAGRIDDDYTVEITVEELMDSSMSGERFIEFEFPKYVQIVSDQGIEVKATGTKSGTDNSKGWTGWKSGDGFDISIGDPTDDTSSFEFTLPDLSNSSKDKFVFTIPVTIEAGTPAGDLGVKVTGAKAGIAETELVVGKILSPVTVDVKMADLRVGIQNQMLGEITIKENFAGALKDKANLTAVITSDIYGNIKDSDAKVEVVEGDLEIDEDNVSFKNHTMTIPIDSESIKTPAEIKISGVRFSTDRTPAEGKYEVKIGGSALIENEGYRKDDFSDNVAEADYINVISIAGGAVYGEAKFVIGEKNYSVLINGELVTASMDTAPYIDSNNRTMIPIRFVANAMGVPDSAVNWSSPTKTASIMGNDGRLITITAGKNYLTVNGTQLPMDTVAVVKDGRVFVPMSYIATALGGTATWDGATKTVSISNNAK